MVNWRTCADIWHVLAIGVTAVSRPDEWLGNSRTSCGTTCARSDSRPRTSSLRPDPPLPSRPRRQPQARQQTTETPTAAGKAATVAADRGNDDGGRRAADVAATTATDTAARATSAGMPKHRRRSSHGSRGQRTSGTSVAPPADLLVRGTHSGRPGFMVKTRGEEVQPGRASVA